MRISRRRFLGAASAAAGFLPQIGGFGRQAERVEAARAGILDCVIVRNSARGGIPESAAGYEAACAAANLRTSKCSAGNLPPSRMILIPGFATFAAGLDKIVAALRAGALVTLESGAVFAGAEEFAVHRSLLRRYFGVEVSSPVNLWANPEEFVPYLDLTWPVQTKVRDFSAAIPVASANGEIIGSVGGLKVAVRKKVGQGTLVILGSPLGPALRAGDREAHGWFRELAASARIPAPGYRKVSNVRD